MSNKIDKITEKPQTTEKAQTNQSHSAHSFLKAIDNKKKEAQVQKVGNQPLEPAAIQANATKTPSMISKETIVNLDFEPEKELEKTKETEGKKEIEENEKEGKEKKQREKLLRENCEKT